MVRIERMQMFLLDLGYLARVMAFAGIEDEEESGQRAERKQSEHAREE